MYFHSIQSGGSSDRKLSKPDKPWYRKVGDGIIYGSRLLNAGRNIYKFVKNPLHWFQYGNDYLEPLATYHPNRDDYKPVSNWNGFGKFFPKSWSHQWPNNSYREHYYEQAVNLDNVYNDPHSSLYRTKRDTYNDDSMTVKHGTWGPWTPYRSFEDLQDYFVC